MFTTLTSAHVTALPLHTTALALPEQFGLEVSPTERHERLHGEFAQVAVRGFVAFARRAGFTVQS